MTLLLDIVLMAFFTKNIGENGHFQWAPAVCRDDKTVIQQRILHFSFQLVRSTRMDMSMLLFMKDLRLLLKDLKSNDDYASLLVLYKLIGQTRDIVNGKGERDLAYMMIFVWFEFFPELAKAALRRFVLSDSKEDLPYGSWKDIKHFCNYVYVRSRGDDKSELITYCIDLMCNQLRIDSAEEGSISLCARWVPRESSKSGCWLFRRLAVAYFPEFVATGVSAESLEKAKKKTYMTFGRMIARLNVRLDTVQIKMCGRRWSEIDHHKTPSVSLMKNKAAFMNNGKRRGVIYEDDRILCARTFDDYIQTRICAGKDVKGKRIGIVDFVKEGLSMTRYLMDGAAESLLNAQWASFLSQVGDLGNMVAMVDQSGSMDGDPYHAAVGLGIAVASKSALGSRIMTFSSEPAWVQLPSGGDFMACLRAVKAVDYLAGFGTNFYRALKLILDACLAWDVPDSVVCKMTLAIFSDMQIDSITNDVGIASSVAEGSFEQRMNSMHEEIGVMYRAAGYSGVPHILFWNLRHTGGVPTLSSVPGATMFSGFSPMLLNAFCSKGTLTTPWDSLVESLNIPRYLGLERDFENRYIKKTASGDFGRGDWDHELHPGVY